MRRGEYHPEQSTPLGRQGRSGRVLRLLGAGLGGVAVGAGVVALARDAGVLLQADLSAPLLLVCLPPVLLLVLLVHQLGHALGGRLAGFRFALLVVGPLAVRREGAEVRLRLNRSLGLVGGTTASVPRGEHRLGGRTALLTAGGPAASLLLGLGALAAGRAAGGAPGAVLGLTALLSLGLCLLALLPLRAGGLACDGARLLLLLRGGPRADRWCAITALTGASLAGVRPRDWSASLVARATSFPDGSPDDVSSMLLAYTWALDTGATARAELHLVRALELMDRLPLPSRPAVALEGAFLAAQHQGDASLARAWLDRAQGGFVEPHVRRRAAAAVLLAEGRAEEALAQAEEGLRLVARAVDAGGARMEREWLEVLRQRARALVPDIGDRPPPSAGEGTARA